MAKYIAYKRFIDELVDISRVDVTAKRIREHGHSERTNDADFPLDEKEQVRRDFFLTLSASQREIIANLLEDSYSSAVHDVASFLEGRLSSDGMTMSWKGEAIPASPYETMHFDFVCRREGDAWPDEGNNQSWSQKAQ